MDTKMNWSASQEELAKDIAKEARSLAEINKRAGKNVRNLYYALSVPGIVLSTAMGITTFSEYNKILTATTFLIIGALNSTETFLNLGAKYIKHFSYSNLYDVLENDIQEELAKSDREDPDVFIAKVQTRLEKLKEDAPVPCC